MDISKCPEYTIYGLSKSDNKIGGFIEIPGELFKVKGYLDLLTGNEQTTNNTFTEESTHILITNYRTGIKAKQHWLVDENNNRYDITLVDDPMNFHKHLEIYLKFIGDKNVSG